MITHGITDPRANQWCFHLVYRNHEGLECGLVDTVGPKRATYTSNWWHNGKESACQCRKHKRHGFNPWVGKIPYSITVQRCEKIYQILMDNGFTCSNVALGVGSFSFQCILCGGLAVSPLLSLLRILVIAFALPG